MDGDEDCCQLIPPEPVEHADPRPINLLIAFGLYCASDDAVDLANFGSPLTMLTSVTTGMRFESRVPFRSSASDV